MSYKDPEGQRKYYAEHQEKRREYSRKYFVEHHEQVRESSRKYRSEHPERKRESDRKCYIKHIEQRREYARKYRAEYPERNRECLRQTHIKIKQKVINHYGGKCACCGESRFEFLTVDHINGGGNKHRREIGIGGNLFYRWLIKNNFPEGFQLLCFNCNMSRGLYGTCPHTIELIGQF